MALIWVEGFDAYGTSNGSTASGPERKWGNLQAAVSMQVGNGRITGKAIVMNNSFATYLDLNSLNHATLTIGMAISFSSANTVTFANGAFLTLMESTNTGINVRWNGAGELGVYFNTTQLAVTSGLGLHINQWTFIELQVTVHNSAGAYNLKVNGTSLLSASGIDTQPGSNAWTDTVRFGHSAISNMAESLDDIYVRSDSTFHGPVKVATIFPTSDSAVDATPSTGGSNFALVDDNPANSDTDYVTANTTDQDIYGYGNISAVANVFGVMVNTVCRETDATPFSIKQIAKSGGTTALSSGQGISSTSYVQRRAIWELNPDTTAAWTESEINAAEFGFEVT